MTEHPSILKFCADKGITLERYYEMKEEYARREETLRLAEAEANRPHAMLNRKMRRKIESMQRKAMK